MAFCDSAAGLRGCRAANPFHLTDRGKPSTLLNAQSVYISLCQWRIQGRRSGSPYSTA